VDGIKQNFVGVACEGADGPAMSARGESSESTLRGRELETYLIFGFSKANQTRKGNERDKRQKESSDSKCAHLKPPKATWMRSHSQTLFREKRINRTYQGEAKPKELLTFFRAVLWWLLVRNMMEQSILAW